MNSAGEKTLIELVLSSKYEHFWVINIHTQFLIIISLHNFLSYLSMKKLIQETEKADEDKKKKMVEDSGITGSKGLLLLNS